MTEAVSAPQSPVWTPFHVSTISTSKKEVTLTDDKYVPYVYSANCDISNIAPGRDYEFQIVNHRIQAFRELEPVKVPVTPAEPPKQEPITLAIGDVSMLTEKGIKIGSHEMVFINGVDLKDIKEGTKVNGKIQGNKLVSIEVAQPSPAELRNGHGTIKFIDLDKPFLSYEFTWKDKQTNEPKSAIQEFSKFTDQAKGSLNRFKVGEKISVKFSGGGKTATLHEIEVDTGRGRGGYQRDPVAEARRQLLMVRENVLNRAVELWINGNPGKVCVEADEDTILKRAEFFEKWVVRE